jgi:SAM-dependent methyltransferase
MSHGTPADGSFASLFDAAPESLAELRRLAERVERSGGTYHRLQLGPDLVLPGDYDLRRYVRHFELPEDLRGSTVLDVGTASGFWALECARRGATVTAVDLYDTPLLTELAPLMKVGIRYEKRSLYDLAGTGWSFDFTVCGSLLLHLPDLLGAARALRAVTKGRAIVSTACPRYSRWVRRPVIEFRGDRAADGDYSHYWVVSAAALERLLLIAGFSRVGPARHFTLESEPGRARFATPHVVLAADAGTAEPAPPR